MSAPAVILRRPHTRTRYTGDPDAIPYRGWYDHAPRPYLTDTVVLDELGRRNGMTHLWLRYACANVGCRYVLLIRADAAHDLAFRSVANRPAVAVFRTLMERMNAIGTALTGSDGGTVMVALHTEGHEPDPDAPPAATFTPPEPGIGTITHVNGIPVSRSSS